MSEKDSDTGTMLTQVFRLALPVLLQMDPAFKVERGLCSCLASGPGEAALWDRVHQCFPDETVDVSLAVCRQRLEAVIATALFRFAAAGPQNLVKGVLAQVRRAESGNVPEFKDWHNNPKLAEVQEYFHYFLRAKDEGRLVFGLPALRILFSDLKKKVAAKEHVPLVDTRVFATFEYLLPAVERAEIGKVCGDVVDAAARAVGASTSASSSSSAPASSSAGPALKRSRTKGGDATKAMSEKAVLDLFA